MCRENPQDKIFKKKKLKWGVVSPPPPPLLYVQGLKEQQLTRTTQMKMVMCETYNAGDDPCKKHLTDIPLQL